MEPRARKRRVCGRLSWRYLLTRGPPEAQLWSKAGKRPTPSATRKPPSRSAFPRTDVWQTFAPLGYFFLSWVLFPRKPRSFAPLGYFFFSWIFFLSWVPDVPTKLGDRVGRFLTDPRVGRSTWRTKRSASAWCVRGTRCGAVDLAPSSRASAGRAGGSSLGTGVPVGPARPGRLQRAGPAVWWGKACCAEAPPLPGALNRENRRP